VVRRATTIKNDQSGSAGGLTVAQAQIQHSLHITYSILANCTRIACAWASFAEPRTHLLHMHTPRLAWRWMR
jgi:hypothetical protein